MGDNTVRLGPWEPKSLSDGDGIPPDNDMMEARVTKLEAFVGEARERLTRVETKLDHVSAEVSQFKWWVLGSAVAIILTMIGTVVGTGIGIQQMTVATFQAAGQQQAPAPAAQQPIIINIPPQPQAAPSVPDKRR